MELAAIAVVAGTAVAAGVLVIHLVRRPGPDARGTTGPPVSQREHGLRGIPDPGESRPADAGAESQRPVARGRLSPNGDGAPRRGDARRRRRDDRS